MMITQKIKRWLDRLFAWWPWKSSSDIGDTLPRGNVNDGRTQEARWQRYTEGHLARLDSTSVALEQKKDRLPENNPPSIEGWQEQAARPSQSTIERSSFISDTSLIQEGTQIPDESAIEPHLAFLRYLVHRGLINEGFEEEHIPDQYKWL